MLCLGPKGTNGHEAAMVAIKRLFGDPEDWQIEFCDRNGDILEKVAGGDVYGVVPIENSSEGLVGEVVKGFWIKEMARRRAIHVIGEIHFLIEHQLLVRQEVGETRQISEVMSHPQALGQCAETLRWLGISKTIPTTSTAFAAQSISTSPSFIATAAIASKFAAQTYGLKTLQANIEDTPGNTTRFHIIHSQRSEGVLEEKARTAVIFKTANEPAALLHVLWSIAASGVNMSSIHSIPLGLPGKYAFYCEFDEHVETTKGGQIMARMETVVDDIIVLGSYPQSLPEKGGVS